MSEASWDSTYNRIVINPAFAELLRTDRVQYLGVDNTYHKLLLNDVIHHEFGHGGDLSAPSSSLNDNQFNNNAEIVERFGEAFRGDVIRAPHGPIQILLDNGSWVSTRDGIDPSSPFFQTYNSTLRNVYEGLGVPYDADIKADSSGQLSSPGSLEASELTDEWINTFILWESSDQVGVPIFLRDISRIIPFSKLGSIFGSNLGHALGGNDPLQQTVFRLD